MPNVSEIEQDKEREITTIEKTCMSGLGTPKTIDIENGKDPSVDSIKV